MAEPQLPTLKLVIEKGSRSPETLEFLPTHPPVRIGRVLRGNSVPIKDSGISTKHLTIQFISNQWMITDMGSSNGTILNSAPLTPLSPAALADGDVVKIGEVTVIRVLIGVPGGDKKLIGKTGREEAAVEGLGGNGEDAELGFRRDMGKKARGRPRKEKVEILPEITTRRTRSSKNEINSLSVVEEIINEEVGVATEVFEKKPKRKTRREKVAAEGSQENGEDTESGFHGDLRKKARGPPKKEKLEVLSESVGTRMTRSSKNEISNLSVVEEILNEAVGVAAEVFEKKTRGGRGRRGKEKALEGAAFGGKIEDLGPAKVEAGTQISTRRTRSSRVVDNGKKEDVGLLGGMKMTRNGRMRNDNGNGELDCGKGNCSEKGNLINVQSGDGLNSEKVVVKSEPRESFCGVENVVNLQNLGTGEKEEEKGGDCNLGQAECVKESGFKGGEAPDLEKMTLGEWFDYLDVYLPKSIYEKTEQIILEMYQKAEKFREFVGEIEKGKGKGTSHMSQRV